MYISSQRLVRGNSNVSGDANESVYHIRQRLADFNCDCHINDVNDVNIYNLHSFWSSLDKRDTAMPVLTQPSAVNFDPGLRQSYM